MHILERWKWGCMGLDTQLKEVKRDTLEIYSTYGFECTKINISEKGSSTFKKKRLKDQEGMEEKRNQQVDNRKTKAIFNCKAIGHLE
jgi:hypothetical protein